MVCLLSSTIIWLCNEVFNLVGFSSVLFFVGGWDVYVVFLFGGRCFILRSSLSVMPCLSISSARGSFFLSSLLSSWGVMGMIS